MGSRKNAKIADEEMIVGIPVEKVQMLSDAVEKLK
jgi:uncharacterized protein (DUF169 family)